ncbi:hypothetical protein Ahy_B05g076269 [Arachis hypogaea]|uniref:Putative plant transposon protein domain-containing protein n=1 Tax=Arachis hypogaea TaxID=3818 RepID=A0A444Z2W8_ARAHY|nr:hypothetical protein Ahy_B05g076269 [Arachis hypogaea]
MASSSSKRQKRKEPMESVPFDEKKFKTAFHECEFERIRVRKILPELIFQINADESPQILEKIEQRGWQLLTSPEGKINGNLIKEFYANVVREDKTKAPTFKSYVRGKEVDFSPNAITRVLHLKSPRFDEKSYQARISRSPDNNELSEIVADICVIAADWERYTDGRPKFIKRGDLSPEAKGWFKLVRRSILPAANNSEVNINRATMVHCLIQGGQINVNELIVEGIQDSAEKVDSGARLWYPSTILRLCNKAKVVFEDSNPDWVNPGRPVTLERLVYTTPAQQQRRPQIGKPKAKEKVHQEEHHQEEYQQEEHHDPDNLNMTYLLRAIEDLGHRHMEGQEQILNLQTNWLSQQEAWQKQQMEQQQEHYSRLTQAINQVNERQELQEKHLQELNQRQIAQMKTFNEFSVLNEGRQLHREEFYVNTQAKLNYMTSNMHQLHYAILTYDEVQKDFVEQEERKVKQQKETLKKKMEDGGFWKKLLGKGKGSGSTSTQERHNEDKQGGEHGHPHE